MKSILLSIFYRTIKFYPIKIFGLNKPNYSLTIEHFHVYSILLELPMTISREINADRKQGKVYDTIKKHKPPCMHLVNFQFSQF